MLNKDLEEIFAIIDDELEKRKLDTFLLWDFPNDVKKRIKELYQSIDNADPSEALEELKELHELAYGNEKTSWKIDEIRMSSHIKQALLKAQEQEKVLEILKSKKYIPLEQINPKFWDNEEDYDETVDYEFYLWLCEEECEYVVKEEQKLTREEFELVKRYYKKKNKKEE